MNTKVIETAWALLMECNINRRLTFEDLEVMCEKRNWNLIDFEIGEGYIRQFRLQNSRSNKAFTHCYDKQYTILYDNKLDMDAIIFEVAKQIGYIMLNKLDNNTVGVVTVDDSKDTFEFACE